jgi:hypothetical protein
VLEGGVALGNGVALGVATGACVGRGVGRGEVITGLSGSTGPCTRGAGVLELGGKRKSLADCAKAGCAIAASSAASKVAPNFSPTTRIS